uniref:Uncharacterized protein n=1 Tax=Ignavibacterium album TaxID=591197 RepID=A0A7V2ZJA5_9BACT
MAIIKKNILGILQGSLSNLVFRERNGKLVAYTRPIKQKVSKSKSAIAARNRFALTVSLAKEINRNEILSGVWNQSNVKATNAYQKIIKQNSKYTDSNNLTLKNIITPEGIPIKGIDIQYDDSSINVSLDCASLDRKLLDSNKLFCLVYLWNQQEGNTKILSKPQFNLQLFNFTLPELNRSISVNFIIDIKALNKPKHKHGIIYLALTGEKNKKFLWSSTLANKFI